MTSVRFLLLTVGALLPFGSRSVAAEMIPAAVVIQISGNIEYCANPADTKRPLKNPGRTLLTGTRLFLPPGASLLLRVADGTVREISNRDGTPETDPDYEIAPMSLPLAAALERSYVAATYRAGCALFSPAHGGTLSPTEPLELRWEPPAGVARLRFAVFASTGLIWETHLDAAPGRATPPALLPALQAAAAAGEPTLFFLCHPADRAPREEDTVAVDVLGTTDAASLARELAACGPSAGPWYHLLRAHVWSQHGVHHAVLAELERALAEPVHARNRKLVTSAADLAEAIGAKGLAGHWHQLAHNLPSDE